MARNQVFGLVIYWNQRASVAQSQQERIECLKRAEEARKQYLEWNE